jgi:uncharacterized membrane protein
VTDRLTDAELAKLRELMTMLPRLLDEMEGLRDRIGQLIDHLEDERYRTADPDDWRKQP